MQGQTAQYPARRVAIEGTQTRDGWFYPQRLEKDLRSERALLLAITEMCVQGVSTRRVKRIYEELCGLEISSSQVSRAATELDDMLEAWRTRDLGIYRYIVLDAQYEVRQTGKVLDAAVLVACGVDDDSHRDILGCPVSPSEAEVHWRTVVGPGAFFHCKTIRNSGFRQQKKPAGCGTPCRLMWL
ncbi:MAG: transposase [Lysobacterales bacterium]